VHSCDVGILYVEDMGAVGGSCVEDMGAVAASKRGTRSCVEGVASREGRARAHLEWLSGMIFVSEQPRSGGGAVGALRVQ
jgi:hypothetical protein